MAEQKFERFGKYLILDHLVDGGMAKICRARFLGEQANKLIAIKMVQPQFSKDPNFVKMFEDELKVTFGLLHPNVVQIYDYGIYDGQLYQAMEYIDGKNLKEYLDRLKSKNFVFPVEISIYIISQVCQALHYAHTFADKMTGKKLNIIHRDISPHNIMLTFDGAVKVIDFGIAKADSNSEATQAGTIKGKLSYLAPEYLDGLALDPRYDEFAVGITLWEMLCSRKLFTAKNDLAVLKQIQACKIPAPSSINPNVPKELDQIVLKALAKDRNQRFEDMDKFNRALVKYLYSNYPDFNATDLGYFAKQLFKEEISKNQKKFVEFGQIDITPYLKDLQSDSKKTKGSNSDGVVLDGPSGGLQEKTGRTSRIELDLGVKDVDATNISLEISSNKIQALRGESPDPVAKSPRIAGKTTATRVSSSKTRVRADKTSTRTSVKVGSKKGGSKNSDGGAKKIVVGGAVAAVAALAFLQPKLVYNLTGVDVGAFLGKPAKQLESPRRKVANDDAGMAVDNSMGQVNLFGYDSSMDVYLNGKKMEMSGIDLDVPLNKETKIEIRKSGYKPFVKLVTLTKDKSVMNVSIPELDRVQIGLLSTSNNYTSGSKIRFQINGSVFEKELPLKNERVPAGAYEGTIVNPLLGTEKKVNFTIEENKKTFLK